MTLKELKRLIERDVLRDADDIPKLIKHFEEYEKSQENKEDKKDDLTFLKSEILKLHEFNRLRREENTELNKRLLDCESHLKFNQEKVKEKRFSLAILSNINQTLEYSLHDQKHQVTVNSSYNRKEIEGIVDALNKLVEGNV